MSDDDGDDGTVRGYSSDDDVPDLLLDLPESDDEDAASFGSSSPGEEDGDDDEAAGQTSAVPARRRVYNAEDEGHRAKRILAKQKARNAEITHRWNLRVKRANKEALRKRSSVDYAKNRAKERDANMVMDQELEAFRDEFRRNPDDPVFNDVPWWFRRNEAGSSLTHELPTSPSYLPLHPGYENHADMAREDAQRSIAAEAFREIMPFDYGEALSGKCCMHCTEPFDGYPVPRAVHYDSHGKFRLVGRHCSAGCALAQAVEFGDDLSLQILFYRRIGAFPTILSTNVRSRIAPPRFSLDKFGGPFSIEVFRANSELGVRVDHFRAPYMSPAEGYAETFKASKKSYYGGLTTDDAQAVKHINEANNARFKKKVEANSRKTGMFSHCADITDQMSVVKEKVAREKGGGATTVPRRMYAEMVADDDAKPPAAASGPPRLPLPIGRPVAKKGRNLLDYMVPREQVP